MIRLGFKSRVERWSSSLAIAVCSMGAFSLWAPAGEDTQRVSFYVSVVDKTGKPVESLTSHDIEVLEDKRPQTLTLLRFEKGSPVSLGILVDISRSMGGERITLALSWVRALAERLQSPDEIFVNAFSEESQELVDFISPEDYLEETLDHLGTGGQCRTGLAVDLGLIKLRDGRNKKKVLLLVSAGRDIAGPATLDHVARFRYPIYALGLKGTAGLGGTVDQLKSLNVKGSALKVYADQSGGNAIFVESTQEAENALETFLSDFKNQYFIEYVSSNPKRDGKTRKIQLKVKNFEHEVRHLRKYQAATR